MAATASPDPVSISLERAQQILAEPVPPTDARALTIHLEGGFVLALVAERRAAANTIVSLYQSNAALEEEVLILDAKLVESTKEKADLIAQLDRERGSRADAERDTKATGQRSAR